MIDYLLALLLGIVEGLTEFLPVSSTAHLLILTDALHFRGPPGHVFEIFIQLGAILAVVVVYFQKFWKIAITLHTSATSRHFVYCLMAGTVPALIAGALLHDFIKTTLYSPVVIAIALIVGGIIILLFEKKFEDKAHFQDVDSIPLRTAFLVGCCQMIALIPGVSRSGASIIGGRALGLSRVAAAELSFFLAVPVMFAAVSYDTYKSWEDIHAGDAYLSLMITGFSGAFLTAMFVIRIALRLINTYGFAPFGWYRIFAGVLVLILYGSL